ncbi:MAG: hypothetical protein KGK14_09245 [Bacteroidota bacterium]|nr:hypothetical protein [Bacteroidota bacterium]
MMKKTTNRIFFWQSISNSQLLTALFILMLAGLLFSRALLSICMLAWAVVLIIFLYKNKLSLGKHTMLHWSILPLGLFLLGAWQQPFQTNTYDFLLTLLTYPIAFFSVRTLFNITEKQKILQIWITVAMISSIYPIIWFATHFHEAIVKYGSGQSMPVLMDQDHIRYSIFLCSAFTFILFQYPFSNKYRLYFIPLFFLLIVFLSVRTAWVILGISLLFIPLIKSIPHRQWITAILVILAGCSYFIFPTVQKKIAYTLYDWQQFIPSKFNSNYSDAARRNLNYIAIQAIQHQSYNVGWADVATTMQLYGEKYFPKQKLQFSWPFNQWLFWMLGSGWIGTLMWSIWLVYPIVWGWQHKQYGVFYWSIAIAISCLVETNLNFQYGVFLHAWPLAIMTFTSQDNNR